MIGKTLITLFLLTLVWQTNAQQQIQSFTAEETLPGDFFGVRVDMDGDTAAVGASGADATYVFRREANGMFAQEARLQPLPPNETDTLDGDVAISGDTLIVTTTGAVATEAVYFFARSGNDWVQIARFEAVDFDPFRVAISGNLAVAAATGFDNAAGDNVGALQVYELINDQWQTGELLTAVDAQPEDRLGVTLDLDGGVIAAGSLRNRVHLFECLNGSCTEFDLLESQSPASGTNFGRAVAISGDTVMVGANGEDSNDGAVYFFERGLAGTYALQDRLEPLLSEAFLFGNTVSIDGDLAVAGPPTAAGRFQRATLFSRIEGQWQERSVFEPNQPAQSDGFGIDTAVSGTTLLVGAWMRNVQGENSGAAYIFSTDLIFSDGFEN